MGKKYSHFCQSNIFRYFLDYSILLCHFYFIGTFSTYFTCKFYLRFLLFVSIQFDAIIITGRGTCQSNIKLFYSRVIQSLNTFFFSLRLLYSFENTSFPQQHNNKNYITFFLTTLNESSLTKLKIFLVITSWLAEMWYAFGPGIWEASIMLTVKMSTVNIFAF